MKNYRNIVVALIIVILFIIVSLLRKESIFKKADNEKDKEVDDAHSKIHDFMDKLVNMRVNINSKEANNEIKLRLEQLDQYLKLLRETQSVSNDEIIRNERNKEFVVLKCSPNVEPVIPVSSSKLTDDEEVTEKILSKIHGELDKIDRLHNFSEELKPTTVAAPAPAPTPTATSSLVGSPVTSSSSSISGYNSGGSTEDNSNLRRYTSRYKVYSATQSSYTIRYTR